MGTNYYAHWTPTPQPEVTISLHICKSLTSFQGSVFPSWRAWKEFLLHNDQDHARGFGTLRVLTEYGTGIPVAQFVEKVEATTPAARRKQHLWLEHNGLPINPYLDWIDDLGFSFHRGEFF